MNAQHNLVALKAIHGAERTAKFLLVLHRNSVAIGRLYYWQKKMLSAFSFATGIKIESLEDALQAFGICPVHEEELQSERVPIFYGTRRPLSPEAVSHADQIHPFVNLAAYGPCWAEQATHKTVSFCSACRESYLSGSNATE
ncbi:hypothetical protein [Variovorax atrisoli]|uniref:hypothetical protein n=1 Tax=Variovorax atrisoli TaxID=3394203 RepID=UPI0016187838|nr:hypothetical protein [Variovorax sp. BK613]MBB3641926.1 hypothetical protein [Variovorax sp. BK613]